MRKVASHEELIELIRQGYGFILNNRDDRRMLHAVKCESLEEEGRGSWDLKGLLSVKIV